MKKYLLLLFLFPFMASSQVDLSIDSIFHRSGVGGYFTKGLEYYSIPKNQRSEVEPSVLISNGGSSEATNVYLAVSIFIDENYTTTLFSDSINLCSGCVDSVFTDYYLPEIEGEFKFIYELFSDSTNFSTNDKDTVVCSYWGYLGSYRRDNNILNSSISNLDTSNQYAFGIGNVFEFFSTDYINQIHVGVSEDSSNEGSVFYAVILKYNAVDSTWDYIEQTNDYIVANQDLGMEISLELFSCVEVNENDFIAICAVHYGLNSEVSFQTCQKVDPESIICLGGEFLETINHEYDLCPKIYPWITETNCYNSISHNEPIHSLSIHPNPTSEKVQLNYNLQSANEVYISIADLKGVEVYKSEVKAQTAGENMTEIDVSMLSEGCYILRLQSGEYAASERLIIQK